MTKAIVQTSTTARTHGNPHCVPGMWRVSCVYHWTTCDIIQSCSSHQKAAVHTVPKWADPALMIMMTRIMIVID